MNGRILFSYFSPYFISRRFLSPPTARFGDALKDIIKPEKIPSEYWKKIIWVAMDLKKTVIEKNKMCLNYFESKHVTLLFGKPHGRFQLAFTIACDLLGLRKTLYHDPFFENQPNPADVGKVLSKLTDMFVIYGLHHDVLIKLVANTTIPIFSAGCNVYCLQKALSDMMTLQEKYHHLKGLTLAWVGPPSSIFNSYLILCPKLGMKIQYTCICVYGSGKMSPVHRVPNGKVCGLNREYLQEFKTAKETVTGAHIIATSMHPEEKNKINLDILKNAQENWYFMHSLPRTLREVSDDVFNHENNLSWDTSENYIYVAMAIIVTCLKDYQPRISMPDFDGVLLS